MARKLWSQLSDSTKKRYKRVGITPQSYNAGKVDPELKRIAQGKSSFTIARAKQQGMRIPGFQSMGIADKRRLADAYRNGLVAPRNPLTGKRNALGLPETERVYTPFKNDTRHPVEVRINPETGFEEYYRTTYSAAGNPVSQRLDSYGRPMRNVPTMESEMDFMDILYDMGIDMESSDLWNDERRSALEASSG